MDQGSYAYMEDPWKSKDLYHFMVSSLRRDTSHALVILPKFINQLNCFDFFEAKLVKR